MSDIDESTDNRDRSPGDEDRSGREIATGLRSYLIGLALAVALTAISFALPQSTMVWKPGIPVALIVFAIAQMGVHLVFFLHINTAPDNTNNVLALAFGVLICVLLIGGSLWIMANLDHNMMPADQMTTMQR
jgi:cytochrome o ubiquinol oxidase operon protein cyoD